MAKKKSEKKPVINDLRRMRLQDGDILLVKESVASSTERSELLQSLENTVRKQIVVIFAQSLSSIKKVEVPQILRAIQQISPAALSREGYYHKSDLMKLMDSDIIEAGWYRNAKDLIERNEQSLRDAGWIPVEEK